MQTLRKRWLPLLIVALVIGGPVAWYKWPSTASAAEASLTAPVKQGNFKVLVTTTGELRARQVRPDHRTGAGAGGQRLSDEDHVDRSGRNGRERRRRDRRARSRAGRDASHRRDARPPEGAGRVHERAARLDAQPRAVARGRAHRRVSRSRKRSSRRSRRSTRRRRSSVRPRSTTRRRSRALEQSKRNLDTKTKQAVAKMSSVGADLGRQQNKLKMVQEVIAQLHHQGAVVRHGDLRSRVERQEEGRRLAVERVGPDRRDAARPHADGVADVRQRSRRAEDRASARKCRSRSTPIRRRSSTAR